MTSEKSYETEQRLGPLISQLGTGAYPNTDGNSYDLTRLTLVLGSNFSIVHATPDTIFTKPVGAGVYEVKVWAVTSNVTAADAAGFAFAFTGTATGLVDYETISGTGPAVVNYTAASTPTQQFNGQAIAGNQKLEVNLTLVVTVAGTLSFTGKQLVGGNNITVFAGSRMRICRVVAT